jgi:ribosomal protein S18 acetylase RimI-like enzyme
MVRIERATRLDQIESAAHLMDGPVAGHAGVRFLSEPGHHLLLAYESTDTPLGFVSGVEMTHPDKGTEMFLYELAVDDQSRGRGIGTALVQGLESLARSLGCYGMWVLTDHDNAAALATYRAAGGEAPTTHAMITWTFDRTPS